ncbi:7TM diverse intracellular signaling domain-containing protein [Saccharibacillus sp. JS10]|uniref:ATP-binding protein n=1 Tax=Saccharibacillus sp. JS10 TaxID=2950552 RepID=UPI00210BAC42|nr:7TM diverse intracellular signaling domain-containing protein [Saccharibacillus sp. JS10]MCQ4086363.1 ATP-binding protein [Saccharibacillus sp. JS10]
MKGNVRLGSRILWIYVLAALVGGLAVSYVVLTALDSPKFESREGILDLTQVELEKNPQKLTGEWAFYWQQLLSPEELKSDLPETDRHWINVPGSWSGEEWDGELLRGTGYGTYRLLVKLSDKDQQERLALRIPSIFHAYKLWVNGELLAEVGTVGTDQASMTPHLSTKFVFVQPRSDTIELVMQVSNFHHHRGGITKSIDLGGSDFLTTKTNLNLAMDMFITASLLVVGLYNLLLFVLRRKDRAPLYFGIFTVLLGIRSLFNGELIFNQWVPRFPWEMQFKIEYLILSLSGMIIMMYFDSIFPNYVSRWFRRSSQIVTSVCCLIILVTPALIYTQLLLPIGVVVVAHMIYLMIGLIRLTARGQDGTSIFLLASVITLVTVVNDFLYYNGLSLIENASPLGLLVFTIAQMILLSSRFTRTAANEERIASELQVVNEKLIQMNMNLEQTVEERTQDLSAAHHDLRNSYDQLLHSEQGRKKLLAYITHDLRMPLASMLGYVEAVQDNVKPERNERYLKYIRENTIRINRMIEELSFLSHLETGQVSYRLEQVSVKKFLRHFFEQYELVVRDAGLDFVLDIADTQDYGAGSAIAAIDTQRLDQALFNLISNAMKFTARGGTIRMSLQMEQRNEAYFAIIGIEDSGTGIPPDQLEQIFNRNYRYDQPGMEKGVQGSGLGLAICREIILGHGGNVRAESDGSRGATFYVTLPCINDEGRDA